MEENIKTLLQTIESLEAEKNSLIAHQRFLCFQIENLEFDITSSLSQFDKNDSLIKEAAASIQQQSHLNEDDSATLQFTE
jgi:hypothetical protein